MEKDLHILNYNLWNRVEMKETIYIFSLFFTFSCGIWEGPFAVLFSILIKTVFFLMLYQLQASKEEFSIKWQHSIQKVKKCL
jgi:hypothetical protein